jgi:hypothetical protein
MVERKVDLSAFVKVSKKEDWMENEKVVSKAVLTASLKVYSKVWLRAD